MGRDLFSFEVDIGMRKFSPEEIEILRQFKGGNTLFTMDELQALSEGNASFKVLSRAEAVIDKYRKHMQVAVSRGEAMQIFLPREEFIEHRHNAIKHIQHIQFQVQMLSSLLLKKGVITIMELGIASAENMIDLCPTCKRGICSQFVTAGDAIPGLPKELSMRVISCPGYNKNEGGG